MMKNKKQTPEDVLMNGNNELPSPFTETFAMPTYSDARPGQTTELPSFQGEEERPNTRFYHPLELEGRPPKEWIIPDLLGRGDIIQLFGPSNEGKTFIAFDLIFACLTGGLFAGVEAEKLSNIAYTTDEGCSGLGNRLKASRVNRNVSKEDLGNLQVTEEVPQLFHLSPLYHATDFIRQWNAFDKPLDLLCIDTQHAATVGANENNATDAGVVINHLKRIQKELTYEEKKPTILLVHHATKEGTTSRGSSAYRGAWDTELQVDKKTFSVTKQKDAMKRKDCFFDLSPLEDSCVVLWNEEKPANKSFEEKLLKFFEDEQGEFTIRDIKEAIGTNKAQIEKLLPKLVESGKLERQRERKGKPFYYFLPKK